MLDVFLTVDVEVWTDDWDLSPRRFSEYYDRYIMGRTANGEYGLRYQLKMAEDHGLKFVFFVEPLFAQELGLGPLRETIDTIREFDQEVALHVHAEWSRKSKKKIVAQNPGLCLRDYPKEDQRRLLDHARGFFAECGVESVSAFRAGSFGANEATIDVVASSGIPIDSSYNPANVRHPMFSVPFYEPRTVSGAKEFPLTVFQDYPGHLRVAQLGSCSTRELMQTLSRARQSKWGAYVLLSHSFELLNGARTKVDPIVRRRFDHLCAYLADHRAEYRTRWFGEIVGDAIPNESSSGPLRTSIGATAGRYAEQLASRLVSR